MINIAGLTVEFTGKALFSDISFFINKRDRIGLVGKNGVGKSTLLDILAGVTKPTKGIITFPDDVTIGYLTQNIDLNSTRSIAEEAMTAFDDIKRLEEEIEKANLELANREDYESEGYSNLLDGLNDMYQRLAVLGGDSIESDTEKILKGLGFQQSDFTRPVSEFSGGWQMRVELAKILLREPSLIILDEPTNHLDIESIIWLEKYFNNYHGAIIMVSHDRTFLDNVTTRTIEIVFGKIYDYKAAYSKYVILRQERYEQQVATIKNQQKYIEEQERFIERFKAKASKAKAAQSKQKQLDKIERIETDELDHSSIRFNFPPSPRSGDISVKASHAAKAYGQLNVLNPFNIQIDRGERIAFVGKNGEGKSTFVQMIMNEIDYDGLIKLGHNVTIGYYAQQQQKTLDLEKTVLASIEDVATDEWANISRIRGLLGSFLFGPDDVDKKVKVLSGGEKARLALAKLLLTPVSLLILDEPTNHLDLSAKEKLKEALLNYDGTLIVVSHDRDFLQGLTSRTFEFKNHGIKEHLGDIDAFLHTHELESFRALESQKKQKVTADQKGKKDKSELSLKEQETIKKENDKVLKKLKREIESSEKKIETIESKIEDLVAKMGKEGFYESSEADLVYKEHESLKNELEQVMEDWEANSLKLEEMI